MHKDLGYISQNLLTKDAGKRNQALRLDVRDCAHGMNMEGEGALIPPSLMENDEYYMHVCFFAGSTWLECTLFELDFYAPWLSQ